MLVGHGVRDIAGGSWDHGIAADLVPSSDSGLLRVKSSSCLVLTLLLGSVHLQECGHIVLFLGRQIANVVHITG